MTDAEMRDQLIITALHAHITADHATPEIRAVKSAYDTMEERKRFAATVTAPKHEERFVPTVRTPGCFS